MKLGVLAASLIQHDIRRLTITISFKMKSATIVMQAEPKKTMGILMYNKMESDTKAHNGSYRLAKMLVMG